MEFRFVNSDGRKEMPFEPIEPGKVGIYCCGPTVYNYAHIGNLRPYTIQDVLVRALKYGGFEVNHVVNITDVGHLTSDGDDGEDKMIKAAREKGMSVWDIAIFFTKAFYNDIDRLNIQRPSRFSKATEHIEDMISMVKTLEDKGFTYQAGGNVYFDTSQFKDYGKMANLDMDALKHGARVAVDNNKKNPGDFVLWFTESKFGKQAMTWDSPWGVGYPGWHIECSAMSTKYLGPHFDIHCGGVDHIPVHHTNEIAQSEAANGCKWVNYWLHNEFIIMKSGKMSKSKGNFLTLQSLIDEGYEPLDYRYFLLGAHYRSQLIFSWESMGAAKSARKSLIRKIQNLGVTNSSDVGLSDEGKIWLEQFENHISQDLNTPRCLADIYGILKYPSLDNREKVYLIFKMDEILGLDLERSIEALEVEDSLPMDDEITKLIQERYEARNNKNFAQADEIRDKLLKQGIRLVDSPEGTRWEKI
ncbi:MAG: cysteine--tRNA ligase [Spirochaetaceae bacterium]|nr:cysteine--tRNA ligase [Spirochaetaceae bacterium]